MRLGILGNMNNNHFSLMRYMRDLGIDAHLLLYSDDGLEEVVILFPNVIHLRSRNGANTLSKQICPIEGWEFSGRF